VITAVDTSVLLDIFTDDPEFAARSGDAMRRCIRQGAIVGCEVAWAELAAAFPSSNDASATLDRLGLRLVPTAPEATLAAGAMWREYRRRGGTRQRMIADFLIGAHASVHADRLLTRDRGFYSSYFDDLTILDPQA